MSGRLVQPRAGNSDFSVLRGSFRRGAYCNSRPVAVYCSMSANNRSDTQYLEKVFEQFSECLVHWCSRVSQSTATNIDITTTIIVQTIPWVIIMPNGIDAWAAAMLEHVWRRMGIKYTCILYTQCIQLQYLCNCNTHDIQLQWLGCERQLKCLE